MTGSITPVAVPALTSTRTPPGRPATEDERILVPGSPRDEPRRPEAAPGRVPVSGTTPAPETPDQEADVGRQIDAERENSIDYRILKAHFKFDREEKTADRRIPGNESEIQSGPPAEGETAVPAESPGAANPQPATASRPDTPEATPSSPPQSRPAQTSSDNAPPQRADPLVLV